MPKSIKVLGVAFLAVALCPVVDVAVLFFLLGTASFFILHFRGRK